MTLPIRKRAALLALTTLLGGCNDKQAHLPSPPAKVRIAR
jgi:hypothetical protein